jgi:hypothetical protein
MSIPSILGMFYFLRYEASLFLFTILGAAGAASALTLLMTGILTDDSNHTCSPHNAAAVAHTLD